MAKVKICGLRRMEDQALINTYLPDYAGFIFVKSRRRYIDPKLAEEIRKGLDPKVKTVGVFVNAAPKEIQEVTDICPVDIIQLHGQESFEEIEKVKEHFPDKEIWKAYSIHTEEDIATAAASPAHKILLDHGAGGTGESFVWELVKHIGGRSFIMAGGITPENAGEAAAVDGCEIIDVSSSLETDGYKDEIKIKALMEALGR